MRRRRQTHAIRILVTVLFAAAASIGLAAGVSQYRYDQPGDKHFVNNTAVLERTSPAASNNQSYKIATPRARSKPGLPGNHCH